MLSPEQIRLRTGKLTASRVACLMTGNAEKIMRLYLEMIGDVPEEDLSMVWPVQLGAATEQLNLDYYEWKNRTPVTRRGEVVIHPRHDWAAATIDGWIDALGCCIECKHVGGREPLEVIIDRYWPQMGWQMEVTGASQCALSVIMGANEPVVEFIERNADYAAEMIVRGRQFMDCVAVRRPPVALPAVPAPIVATKTYDLSTNNSWADAAFIWLDSHPAAGRCKDAEKILKSLVPEDAKKCFGAGVIITKDRSNRMYLREKTP